MMPRLSRRNPALPVIPVRGVRRSWDMLLKRVLFNRSRLYLNPGIFLLPAEQLPLNNQGQLGNDRVHIYLFLFA